MLSSLLQCTFLSIGMMFPSVIANPTVISDVVWGIPSIVCDSVITIEMTRLKELPFAETNSLIRKLIQFTIETGAVTPAAMALGLLLCNYDPTSDVVVTLSKQEIVISQWPYSASIAQLIVYVAPVTIRFMWLS
ncbi:hypothetical protein OG21DRAFT_1489686 [Imleria badia]|nr:hypothetical protein OG21DRAFT_1489686 [Imleria badia]